MHRTGLDRPVDDQGRLGTVQILLVEIDLLVSEDFPASLEQQPFRLRLNGLDHIPVRPLCNLERVRLNLYASDCSAHRSSSPFRRDCSDGMRETRDEGRPRGAEALVPGPHAGHEPRLLLRWPLRSQQMFLRGLSATFFLNACHAPDFHRLTCSSWRALITQHSQTA